MTPHVLLVLSCVLILICQERWAYVVSGCLAGAGIGPLLRRAIDAHFEDKETKR